MCFCLEWSWAWAWPYSMSIRSQVPANELMFLQTTCTLRLRVLIVMINKQIGLLIINCMSWWGNCFELWRTTVTSIVLKKSRIGPTPLPILNFNKWCSRKLSYTNIPMSLAVPRFGAKLFLEWQHQSSPKFQPGRIVNRDLDCKKTPLQK